MSAVCTHAIRYGWMKMNPIRAVRQSAKREYVPIPLVAEELQRLFAELGLRESTLILLDLSVGMRRGELLATKWEDVDFQTRTPRISKSIWQQLGPVKTEESEKVMPLDEETIATLELWRQETVYAQDSDWIFASSLMRGRQPLWPESLMRNYIVPAARRAGITKRVNWHVFRHTFSTLLAVSGRLSKQCDPFCSYRPDDHLRDLHARHQPEKKLFPKQGGGDGDTAGQKANRGGHDEGSGLMCTTLCTMQFQQQLLSC